VFVAWTVHLEYEGEMLCPTKNVKDPLKWWFGNCMVYPNLSQMALDYPWWVLSIAFGMIDTHIQMFLSYVDGCGTNLFSRATPSPFYTQPSSIHTYLCLGSWGRHDMLRKEDILAAIKCKKRKRVDTE
jgi:hypothetical protein